MGAFEDRANEVDRYFRFLRKALKDEVVVLSSKRATGKSSRLDDGTQKMLKACALLLLYNLVESSVRTGIASVYDDISRKKMTFEDVREEIKSLWIKFRTHNLTKGAPGIDAIRTNTRSIIDDIVKKAIVQIDRKFMKISGNLDAQGVRALAKELGFPLRADAVGKQGASLKIVKDKRNDLAHGVISFAECGREFTFDDLQGIKQEVKRYLRTFLRNIEEYVRTRAYVA